MSDNFSTSEHHTSGEAVLNRLKLLPPLSQRSDLFRMRLVSEMNEAAGKRLTVVTAPVGYGKTTLLGHWASQPNFKTAWLTLENSDNDPAQFFRNLIAALQTVNRNIGSDAFTMLQSQQDISMEKVLQRVIDQIGMVLQDFTLILDDYQAIRANPVHNMLTYLLAQQPPQLHLLIASQTDPPFELHKLRSSDDLKEIRSPHLAFTMDEAGALFNEVMQLKLPYGDISALVVRTKAQPAALKYAALSLKHFENISDFISEFENDSREESIFLVEILLKQQPEEVQALLRQCALLPQLTPALCAALSGAENSAEILEHLAGAGAFVQQIDKAGQWYRFHSFLTQQAAVYFTGISEEKRTNLHLRASLWFTQHKMISRAFYHALEAQNFDLAGQFVEENAMEMLQQGQLVTVLNWMSRIPARIFESRPMLSVCQAWIAIISGDLSNIEQHLSTAEQANRSVPDPRPVAGHIAAIRDYLDSRD